MKYIPFLFVGLVISIALYYFAPGVITYEYMFALLLIAALVFVIFITRDEKNPNLQGQYLKHSFLFLFAYSIVHYQYPLDLLLGNSRLDDYFVWINEAVIVKSLALAVVGFIAFVSGYFIKGNKFGGGAIPDTVSTLFLPFAALVALLIYFRFADSSYLSGSYGIVKLSGPANYAVLLLKVLVFAYLIQHSRNLRASGQSFKSFIGYAKSNNLIINIIIVVYLFTVMLSGDRGPIIYWCIAYYGCYLFVSGRKLGIGRTIVYLLLGVFFISTLGHVRSLDRSMAFTERFASSAHLEGRFDTSSFSPKTQELGRSIRTVHMAVDYVPKHHQFLYGRFQYQQLVSIIPFASPLTTFFFDDNSYKYGGSSRFLTWVEQGDTPYSGVGSSVISDFYLDFGLFGVVIGMFIFGFIIRYSELAMYSGKFPGYFANALFICLLSMAIYIPRSTFLVEIKFVVWVYIVLIINRYVVKKIS